MTGRGWAVARVKCANPEVMFDVSKGGLQPRGSPSDRRWLSRAEPPPVVERAKRTSEQEALRTIFMSPSPPCGPIIALFGTLGGYLRARSARSSGNYQTVEPGGELRASAVQRTRTGAYCKWRSVLVLGLCRYAWFPQSQSHGGPIHERRIVRSDTSTALILRLKSAVGARDERSLEASHSDCWRKSSGGRG